MMKTLRQILAEKDDEFTYEVKSVHDIHEPEIFGLIKLALTEFKVRSIEKGSYRMPGRENPDFPKHPNMPVYAVRVVTAYPVPMQNHAGLQMIAMFTRIDASNLRFEMTGVDPRKDNDEKGTAYRPVTGNVDFTASTDVVVDGAQDMVAQKRLGAFMKSLKANRDERREEEPVREVYESFVMTHSDAERFTGRPFLRGSYIIEHTREGDAERMVFRGPHAYAEPLDKVYVSARDLLPGRAEYVREGLENGKVIVEFNVSGIAARPVMRRPNPNVVQPVDPAAEVPVQDTDTGQRFQAQVPEVDDTSARNAAVSDVAAKQGVSQNSLIAGKPRIDIRV